MKRACENCSFFRANPPALPDDDPEDRALLGECRRHAPPPLLELEDSDQLTQWSWLWVLGDEWCGEFQPRADD